MSKTPDNRPELEAGRARACRIAYTLNNEQPVRCSYVSDQPLFYMDFEGDIEDDMFEPDAFAIEEIEEGVLALQRKISALDTLSERFEQGGEKLFQDFLEDAAEATKSRASESCDEKATLKTLTDKLHMSRLGAAYLNFATPHGTKIHFDREIKTAFYDRESGQIYLNPNLDEADQLLLAARELRRMWQHRNGALLHPLTFQPDQAILVNRAQIADLAASMIRIAWELQLADEKEAWERLENSSMADMARAFAREAYLDFRTLNNGVASSAVFETWFLSERCRHEDRNLIQQMLADYQGYVFEHEDTSKQVSAELVYALGSMPFGKNYLAPYASTILNDALFTEVRDRSNANFLWFIKFEKSFRETEQELQTANTHPFHDDLHGNSQNNKKRFGDNEEEKVITLPGGEAGAGSAKVSVGGAKIIEFRRESGRDS